MSYFTDPVSDMSREESRAVEERNRVEDSGFSFRTKSLEFPVLIVFHYQRFKKEYSVTRIEWNLLLNRYEDVDDWGKYVREEVEIFLKENWRAESVIFKLYNEKV